MSRFAFVSMFVIACGGAPSRPVAHEPVAPQVGVVVPFQTGFWYGARGDEIRVDEVRGDHDRFVDGGKYHVRGHYVLRSHPDAILAVTILNGRHDSPNLANRTVVRIGAGTFDLPLDVITLGHVEVAFYSSDTAGRTITRADGFAETFIGQGDNLLAHLDVKTASPVSQCEVVERALSIRGPMVNPIAFDQRDARFGGGDEIHIDEVRSDRNAFAACGVYTVRGHYTLKSHTRAELAINVMSGTGSSGSSDSRSTTIDAGNGVFALQFTFGGTGWPHVSFYPSEGGDAFGIAYFGSGAALYKGDGDRVTDRTSR